MNYYTVEENKKSIGFLNEDVHKIEIEKGLVGRYSKGEPFTIILRKSPSELTFVENPSVILVLLFLFKCKNAKIKIKKWRLSRWKKE